MRKQLVLKVLTVLCLSSIITGCGNNDEAGGPQGQQQNLFQGYQTDTDRYVMNRRANDVNDKINRFGFDHETRETALSAQKAGGYAIYDRPLMAQNISELAALNPGVNEVATLVTDQHVLMAYDTTSDNREEVATQVKKTALSLVPAYFDIYVSDNPGMIQEIEKFQGLSPLEPDYVTALDQTIDEMKTYPQGEDVDLNDPMLKDTRYNGTKYNNNNDQNGMRNGSQNR